MKKNDIYEVLDLMANMVSAPFYWIDLEGKFVGLNDHVVKAVGGKEKADILGKTCYEVYQDQSIADELQKDINEIIKTGKYSHLEDTIIDMTTREARYYMATRAPLQDKNGNIIGVIGTSIETTDQKKRQILEKQKIVLEEKINGLQLMGGAIATEINGPLKNVLDAIKNIEAQIGALVHGYKLAVKHNLIEMSPEVENNRPAKESVDEITSSLVIANVFTNTILSNLKTMAIPYEELEPLSMAHCINSSISNYKFRNLSDKTLFNINIESDFKFKGSFMLFQQVIHNLIKNAIKYVNDAGRGQIDIWTESTSEYNALHIKDTGRGITKEKLPHIFDSFFSPTENNIGIDVGLGFSRLVINQFNGIITCDSEPDQYTHFIIRLPNIKEKIK